MPSSAVVDAAADQVMADIDRDKARGRIPATVRSFADLHDFVDANEYLLDLACLQPHDSASQAQADLANAIMTEVNRRL